MKISVCYGSYKYTSPKAPLTKYLDVKKRGQTEVEGEKTKHSTNRVNKGRKCTYLWTIHVTGAVNNPDFWLKARNYGIYPFFLFARVSLRRGVTEEDGERFLGMMLWESWMRWLCPRIAGCLGVKGKGVPSQANNRFVWRLPRCGLNRKT